MAKYERFIGFLCFFIFLTISAQELPPIRNFSPENYSAGNQNWMISQSNDQSIFIANNTGLLQYNGAKWNLKNSPNGSVIRSVKIINDIVYTGCYMEFGFWKRDMFGDMQYNSLIPKLDKKLIEDEQFWNIQSFQDWILFQSLDRIYVYNTKTASFNIIEAKTSKANIFIKGNSIYFQNSGKGLFKIENGKSVLVSNNKVLRENNLVGVFLIKENITFLLDNGVFYYFIDEKIVRQELPITADLSDRKIYCSLQLADQSVVLGTISHGVYHLNNNGVLIRKIDREHGLRDNTILSMFEDKEENLWLALDNGISVINLKSHFSAYNDFKGRLGAVYTSKIHKGFLYLGTNQGLFKRPIGTDIEFEIIKGTQGQVWSLDEIDGMLFCGHNYGTFIVEGNTAKIVSDFPGTWGVKKVPHTNNLLLQGNYEGLSVLENSNGSWTFRNKIEGFDISARYFEFNDDNEIVVNHDQKGIFFLELDKDYRKIVSQSNMPSYGYGSSLVKYNDDIIYTTNFSRGVYSLDGVNKEFVLDSVLTKTFYREGDGLVGTLISDQESKKLWGFSKRSIICVSQGKFSSDPQIINVSISDAFRRSLGLQGFENVSYSGNDAFLIGATNGYVNLELNTIPSKKHEVKIDAVYNWSLDQSIERISLNQESNFDSNENNLKIDFSVPYFAKFSKVEYQYQLVGIYDQWSSWTVESEVEFENLPFGDYTFNLRSRIGNQISSNKASFIFEVNKPWYLTNISLSIYSLAILLFSLGMHKIYKVYYSREQERAIKKTQRKLKIENLKNEKELMRIKNENLRLDIDNRNREVGTATMSLIRKNEFLGSLKAELKRTKSLDDLKHIIEIIDKNLNNTDDWKLFEKAFTNADRDFFDKIKSVHPNLTPNDLKLCAYLRLNLSSKEIAQLLNISTRSVEIKRYRLRKKIELASEINLSQYISEI